MIRSASGKVGHVRVDARRRGRCAPSSASCSTTTATNVLVTLPMFHGTSRSTARLAGSTVVVPSAASVMCPSRIDQRDPPRHEVACSPVRGEDGVEHLGFARNGDGGRRGRGRRGRCGGRGRSGRRRRCARRQRAGAGGRCGGRSGRRGGRRRRDGRSRCRGDGDDGRAAVVVAGACGSRREVPRTAAATAERAARLPGRAEVRRWFMPAIVRRHLHVDRRPGDGTGHVARRTSGG